MKEIPLSNGMIALVDDEDYELVSQYTWTAWKPSRSRTWYAVSGLNRGRGANVVLLHRFIMRPKEDEQVDHISGEGLDNRRITNLRIVTPAQQTYNRLPQKGKLYSDYKGVTWCKSSEKWKAQIMKYGKNYALGYFNDEVEAANAYDLKALELFGEYAKPNFVKEVMLNDSLR